MASCVWYFHFRNPSLLAGIRTIIFWGEDGTRLATRVRHPSYNEFWSPAHCLSQLGGYLFPLRLPLQHIFPGVPQRRLGRKVGVSDAVGTLGSADELLALVACPLWGALSDRMASQAWPSQATPLSILFCGKWLFHCNILIEACMWLFYFRTLTLEQERHDAKCRFSAPRTERNCLSPNIPDFNLYEIALRRSSGSQSSQGV